MKNKFLTLALAGMLLAACEKEAKIPDGFEEVSKDGSSHFVYMSNKDLLGNRSAQREAGRAICTMYKQQTYCEVLFFDDKNSIPKQFPIMNRVQSVGTFKMKDSVEEFKVLK